MKIPEEYDIRNALFSISPFKTTEEYGLHAIFNQSN